MLLDHPPLTSNGFDLRDRRQRGILVADDDGAIRDMLRIYLETQGFQVWTASTGLDALGSFSSNAPSIAVVLLDIQMPGLDGPQTFDGIRRLNANVPVCFMTADPGNYNAKDLLERGAKCVFQKPFRMREIARILHSLLDDSN